MDMKTISNEEEVKETSLNNVTNDLHDIKLHAKRMEKLCKEKGVPFFLTYYHPQIGYSYNGVFPEEIKSDDVKSEYWRFLEFLKIVVGFNKDDYKPIIKKNTK